MHISLSRHTGSNIIIFVIEFHSIKYGLSTRHFASTDTPISYPVGANHDALHQLAHTKADAYNIAGMCHPPFNQRILLQNGTGADAHTALTPLGLEDLPQAANACRRRFLEYIGINL